MTQVIKRGCKKRESFNPSKIRGAIKNASKDAGFSASKVEEVVKEVGNGVIDFFGKKKIVKSVDIRKSILGRLKRSASAVEKSWKKFEKKKSGRF
jgi:transcriptional regulator NrdR family protein